MKNTIRKAISVTIVFLILFSAAPINSLRAAALTSGSYTYVLTNNGTQVQITRYTGTGTNITLPSVISSKPVTSIGEEAFSDCTTIKSITIPGSINTIGHRAFWCCSSLASIHVDSANKNYCSDDSGVLFNENKTILMQYPAGSANTSYTIPAGVTSIGYEAFEKCASLSTVTIPDGVKSIGWNAFAGCSSIASIDIPNSVTYIGQGAFSQCTSLSSIILPNSIGRIDTLMFSYCRALSDITIPIGVTSIGDGAFSHCPLKSVTIPNGVTSIGSEAFSGGSFSSVIIPDSVTSIGEYAFSSCTLLTNITIPGSATTIGTDAFTDTYWYNHQPNGLVYAGNVAYKYKGKMATKTPITLRDGTTGIAGRAFFGCSLLSGITIPGTVKRIGDDAFSGCGAITNFTIPGSVTSIGNRALSDTLWYTNQSNGVVYAGKVAYKYKGTMPANTSITLHDGTTGIADFAFCYCETLKSITIPGSVINIGDCAFAHCSSLKSLTIPSSVIRIGEFAFDTCSSLAGIKMPNSVKSIGIRAFQSCSSLAAITIPNGITNIDDGVFCGCSLKSVIIPNNITSIGTNAFADCKSLKSISIPSNVKSIGDDVFFDCNALTIYGSADSYAKIYAADNTIPFKTSCTVTFNSGGGSAVAGKTANYNTAVTAPTAPTKTGYTFAGWYSAASGGTKVIFPYTLKLTTTFYAHWTAKSYKITFNSGGGSAVSAKTLTYGTKVTSFPMPTKSGYKFAGWYTVLSGGTKISYPYTIKANVTLYAHWVKK